MAAVNVKADKALRAVLKFLKGAVSFAATAVILLAVAVAVLYLFRIRPYVVTSGSMEPAIPVRSVCFVNERAELSGIKPGEVISFRLEDGSLVTHRVTEIKDGVYVTKGDANNAEDEGGVTGENYVGKTVIVIPKAGGLLIFLHSTAGRIAAAAAIILLLTVTFIPGKKPSGEGDTSDESNEKEGSSDGQGKA